MNILILTGRFGMGHVKAAEAIREDILKADNQTHVNIVDFTEYLFPRAAEYIYSGFNFLTSHCSQVYNYFNQAANRYGRAPFQDALLGRIDQLLSFHRPDLIIATLPFCGQYISAYKERRGCSTPLYTYITDVTLHEEWIAPHTDLYFVAARKTRQALLSRGVPPGKIIVSGVPVRQAFYPASDRLSAKKLTVKNRRIPSYPPENAAAGPNSAPPHRTHVLIMGGGLGIISCGSSLMQTLHQLPHTTVTVITGKNVKLARQLRQDYPNFRILGYTEEVHRYMKEADLLITKPGGITMFEAIASRTPLFILPPGLAQEKENAAFIETSGIGYVLHESARRSAGKTARRSASSMQEDAPAAEILREILESPHTLQTMRRNMLNLDESFQETCPLNYFVLQ